MIIIRTDNWRNVCVYQGGISNVLRNSRRGVGSDRCRPLKKGERCVKNAKLSVTEQLNVPSAAIWSKLANLVWPYHLSQSMRKATFQLHFYFYDDILIVVNISVYKTFFISLSLEILNHLSLYVLSTFLIISKGL